jgi:ubiquitin-activating enzyme E1
VRRGDTESTFNDDFWNGLSGVCTALDNVEARLYVDNRCVYYGKPMLESGTLGTKGNTQVIVPGMTENYGASRDPPEQGIPVCTLKNFPFKIEHTLQWARDWFEGEFKQVPDAVNAYLTQPNFFELLAKQPNSRIDTLEKVYDALVTTRPSTVDDCVSWARLKFEELFSNTVRQLVYNFPADSKVAGGEPFWSGAKRQPSPVSFDSFDDTHMAFIVTVAQLRATIYGIAFSDAHSLDFVRAAVQRVSVPRFEPQSGLKIAANDKELEEQKKAQVESVSLQFERKATRRNKSNYTLNMQSGAWDVDSQAIALQGKLPPVATLGAFRAVAQDFEKDDDLHISIVTATSNLRARNYRIDEADKHTSKGIAGKIIPAIATTTALVTGFVCLELYKLLSNKPIEAYKSGFANLALPFFSMSEPLPARRYELALPSTTSFSHPAIVEKAGASGQQLCWRWSVWDKVDVTGPKTVKEIIEFMKAAFGVDVQMIAWSGAILFAFYLPPAKKRERLNVPLGILAPQIAKRPLQAHARYLTVEITGVGADGNDVELPVFRYQLGAGELAHAESAASS